jgi:hypothetical protein
MKHSILLIAFLLISIQVLAQNYGLNNADPTLFTKYKVPETNLSTLYFNTQMNFNSAKNDNSSSSPNYEYSSNSFNYNFNSSLTPSYYLLKENDDNVLSLNAYANGSYSNNYSKNENSLNTNNNYAKQINWQLYLSLVGNYKNYLSESYLFYSFGSNIRINMTDERFEGYYLNDSYGDLPYKGTKDQNYNILMGVGWGKMRNVTPVVSAIRLQERLKQLNLLNDDFNESTIEDLAEQFSKEIYYSNVYNMSGKYFWGDIEKTLAINGVSLSGLNQYGSYYLKEISNEIRFQRNEGILGGINLQLDYYSYYANSNISEVFFTLANIYFNYSHQLNLNSQINFNISFNGGPNITNHPYVRQKYSINSVIGYNYELTDRVVTSISNTFSQSFTNSDGQPKTLTNDVNLSVNYFIEDKISLNTSYELFYSNNKYFHNKGSQLNNILSLGLTYYIDKGFLYK